MAYALGELCHMAVKELDLIVFQLHGFEWSFPFLLGIAPRSSLHCTRSKGFEQEISNNYI